ncbi:MAG TPA: hypothetical protein ENJ18_07915 [Nannocystis exedens]|nr:hypothetical protein [Nannocystis exedens]
MLDIAHPISTEPPRIWSGALLVVSGPDGALQTREHILLGRQVGIPSFAAWVAADTTPRRG